MSNITFGEVDWGDINLGSSDSQERVSDFLILKEGNNKVRILSKAMSFATHWVTLDDGTKRKVNCATAGCPVCKRGQDTDKPKPRWLIKVLNRDENRIQLLEIGPQIASGIKTLVDNEDWGPVTDYDVNIKRNPAGSKPLYAVMPGKRAPLTTDEKALFAAFNERVDATMFIKPPKPEEVAEKLGWAVEAPKAVSNEFRSGNGSKPAAKKPAVDVDWDFDSK